MNDVIQTILARKGTKRYTCEPIPRETLELLARVGIAAPNAYNAQKWHFSILTNQTLLNELEHKVFLKLVETGVCKADENYAPFYHAPAVFIFSADQTNEFARQDCSAANENVAIAAKSLGIGSRFLDVPNQFFHSEDGEEYRARCGIPADYETVCFLSLGFPEDPDEQPNDKRRDVVTFVD